MDGNQNNSQLKLFLYQKESILQIEDFGGRTLLALEMGLGKTIVTLKWLQKHPESLPALVVCPASVKYIWEHEALTHVNMRASICEGQKPPIYNRNRFSSQSPLMIINYDILQHWEPYLQKIGLKTVIFDESQYLGNPKAKRTKASKALSKKIKHCLALSGTPLTNRPAELWPILNILWPKDYNSFWSYAQSFCAPRYTHWGWDYSGSSNLNVLHRQLLLNGMIRRRKVDVLKDLPKKVRRVLPCELRNRSEYEFARDDFMSWLRKNKPNRVRSASKAEKMTRIGYLLRLSAKLKLRSVVDWANRFLDETDEKLVLFAIHRGAINVLQKRVEVKSVVVDGGITGRMRQAAVEQFQKDKGTRLLIGNIQAAGVGLTLTSASTVGFVEMSWRPGDHVQAEDRIHRIGQEKTSWIYYLVAGDTLEERLCHILQQKQKVISSVLDGGPTPQDLNVYDELLRVLERRVQ